MTSTQGEGGGSTEKRDKNGWQNWGRGEGSREMWTSIFRVLK